MCLKSESNLHYYIAFCKRDNSEDCADGKTMNFHPDQIVHIRIRLALFVVVANDADRRDRHKQCALQIVRHKNSTR